MTTAAEAGWYDDGSGRHRWWDGTRWSDQYIDLRERETTLHSDAGTVPPAANAGWYDDGRGRQRWWDGARWTDAARFSGDEESFAGIVVDGRWIHFGPVSLPVGDAVAAVESGKDLLRRGRLGKAATARTLQGPAGPITPRLLPRAVSAAADYLLVEIAGQVWLAAVPRGDEARARTFAGWINAASQHYRHG